MLRFEDILEKVESYHPKVDEDLLRRAYVVSAISGESFRASSSGPLGSADVRRLDAEEREIVEDVGAVMDVMLE